VTSSHGSRDGLASRARPPEGEGGDGGDGGEFAERDEVPELRAMRSVWLAMRDEDPPERGLAELLAAARAKAETMQARPTLWQRLAAGLGRPPALALATVLVLVGGAVFLGRRGVDAPVGARAPEPSGIVARAPASSAAAPVGGAHAADGSFVQAQTSAETVPADELAATKFGAGSGGSPMTPEAAAKLEVAVRHKVSLGGASAGSAAVAPAVDLQTEDAALVVTDYADPGGASGNAVAPPSPSAHVAPRREPTPAPSREPPASASAPEGTSTSDDLAGTARSSHNAPPVGTADVAKQAGKKAGKEAKDDEVASMERDKSAATSGASPGASIAQLYKQCEAAARRGDCAAVRRLVDRIARSDRGYRARVAKDSPVGKCLAE